jgi:APA family basic amino acid/polyamine antiporter
MKLTQFRPLPLLRNIGRENCCAFIGAGILRTPGEVASYLPNTWLFLGVWLIGGLYALPGAVSIAELGAMIPRSGGQFVFVRRALGDYPGFIVGWSDWVSTCGSVSLISMVIAEYSGVLIPALSSRAACDQFAQGAGFHRARRRLFYHRRRSVGAD